MEQSKGFWITMWSYAQRRTSFTRWEAQKAFSIDVPNNCYAKAIRLKFSNWYGTESKQIEKAFLIYREKRYSVLCQEAVSFCVSNEEDLRSDTIGCDLEPGNILTAEIYFADYIRPESGNTFQGGVAMILQSVEVLVEKRIPVVAFFGDSIMHRRTWTDPLIQACYQKYPGRIAAFEVAIDGSRLLNDSPVVEDETLGYNAKKRFVHDVLENIGITHVFFCMGLNDLSLEESEGERFLSFCSYVDTINEILDLAQENHVTMIGMSIAPRCISGPYTQKKNELRKRINSWLKGSPFNEYFDIAELVRNAMDDGLKTGYDNGDGVHFSNFAGQEVAKAIFDSDLIARIVS